MSKNPTQTCFVISPIGREGTETHRDFREVLDYVIVPAVRRSGYTLEVLRADDIERPGSFIKDILQQLLNSFVVIADLTNQNPNVFYELGVRHALSPRTILIAQSVDDIPSDLREYRTIVYDTSARGAAQFRERLQKFLNDIFSDPRQADNPVLDRLGSVIEQQLVSAREEITTLRRELDKVYRRGLTQNEFAPNKGASNESVIRRADRILQLYGAKREFVGEIVYGSGEERRCANLPANEGEFRLYFLENHTQVESCLYFATLGTRETINRHLSDARVIMGVTSSALETKCTFVTATSAVVSEEVKQETDAVFNRMKEFLPAEKRNLYSFEVWDTTRLTVIEEELGVIVPQLQPPDKGA